MKQSGLGDQLLVSGYVIGGDVQSYTAHGGPALLDVTDITQAAHSRLPGLRDGGMELTTYFDPAPGASHALLSQLPTSSVIATLLRGQGLGLPALMQQGKQISYDPTRAADGSLTLKVTIDADPYGQEWGSQLTPGIRTDTAGTNGAAVNNGAGYGYGAQLYLQAASLTGSTATVTVQHAPDGSTWTALGAFAAVTSAPQAQRLPLSALFACPAATPGVFSTSAPGALALPAGQPVQLSALPSGQPLPGGFTAGTTYYVVSPSGASFSLAATVGGSAIAATSGGSGVVAAVVQQYLRVVTSGTFTGLTFAVAANINRTQVVF